MLTLFFIPHMETADLRVGIMDSSFQKMKDVEYKTGVFKLFLDDQSCDDPRLRMNAIELIVVPINIHTRMNVIKLIVFPENPWRTSRGSVYDTFYGEYQLKY